MISAILILGLSHAPADVPKADDYFTIRVVDQQTGRGVPLVELRTVNNIRYYTDSAGIVAFYEPGLMNRDVFFFVKSRGYEFEKDGFGMRGKRLKAVPGSEATLKIKRINIAQRLYRVTGAGIYRDSMMVGLKPPTQKPLLNAKVFGSDSVVNTIYRGKIYWFWGDTNKPSYPLGNFFVPGATSLLPEKGGLDPEKGVNLHYFTGKDGFAKPTAKMPGPGPTWIGGLVALKDKAGKERLFAEYVRVKKGMQVYERGILEFNDEEKRFDKRLKLDLEYPLFPHGHPFKHVDDGVEYVYFANPFPTVRVRATVDDFLDVKKYQAWTYLLQGTAPTQCASIDVVNLAHAKAGDLARSILLRSEGAKTAQPKATPWVFPGSKNRALKGCNRDSLFGSFRAILGGRRFPGRCPGLCCLAPLEQKNKKSAKSICVSENPRLRVGFVKDQVKRPKIDRDANVRLRFAWRTGGLPLTQKLQNKLLKDGAIKKNERLGYLQEVESGKMIQVHSGSIAWNPYRKRWVMIALEAFGSSFLGEVWYAEAKSLTGPWSRARKIVTHEKYSFYNPKQHPMLAKAGGRYIFFEGTYASTFSGNEHPTPRYDYNQIMYKLDLADKRLHLP